MGKAPAVGEATAEPSASHRRSRHAALSGQVACVASAWSLLNLHDRNVDLSAIAVPGGRDSAEQCAEQRRLAIAEWGRS